MVLSYVGIRMVLCRNSSVVKLICRDSSVALVLAPVLASAPEHLVKACTDTCTLARTLAPALAYLWNLHLVYITSLDDRDSARFSS